MTSSDLDEFLRAIMEAIFTSKNIKFWFCSCLFPLAVKVVISAGVKNME